MKVTSNKSSHVSSVKEPITDLGPGPDLTSLNVSISDKLSPDSPPQLMDDGHDGQERAGEGGAHGEDVTGM